MSALLKLNATFRMSSYYTPAPTATKMDLSGQVCVKTALPSFHIHSYTHSEGFLAYSKNETKSQADFADYSDGVEWVEFASILRSLCSYLRLT
jgi:hypothetical protein